MIVALLSVSVLNGRFLFFCCALFSAHLKQKCPVDAYRGVSGRFEGRAAAFRGKGRGRSPVDVEPGLFDAHMRFSTTECLTPSVPPG